MTESVKELIHSVSPELKKQILRLDDLMENRNYPESVRETVMGAVHLSSEKAEMVAEVALVLAENEDKKSVVKAMQPLLNKAIAELEASSRRSGTDTSKTAKCEPKN